MEELAGRFAEVLEQIGVKVRSLTTDRVARGIRVTGLGILAAGALLSGLLYQTLGWAAWSAPLLMLFLGWRVFWHRPSRSFAGMTGSAVALVALTIVGERGPVGVVATAFLAYWGGFDVAFGAVPLMEGESYAFNRPLDPDDGDVRRSWDRL